MKNVQAGSVPDQYHIITTSDIQCSVAKQIPRSRPVSGRNGETGGVVFAETGWLLISRSVRGESCVGEVRAIDAA